jgi:hypothetical protein
VSWFSQSFENAARIDHCPANNFTNEFVGFVGIEGVTTIGDELIEELILKGQ